ncbi:tetratricopeptide repeat protein [uncultured Desulfobacter sp.]|uniref:tetratricopeptide repeat protein n=1 Tax=uncultured Desulfobacter sp. TaxID=240139 RepID=UPI0029F54241|nr:tetratricopeptide repeat protein [uncultured Desulfobacter sp.]
MDKEARNDVEQIFQKSYISHKAGRFAEAEKGYRQILKIKPEWGQAMSALGILYLDQNRTDKAIPLFERAAGLSPPDLSACYQLGRLKQMENDHQGAIPIYQLMLEQQPEAGLVWNNLGVAYRETGQADDAMESFRAAIRFAADMAEAWNNLGVALDEQGQVEPALNAYQKAIKIQPEYVSPHLNSGIIFQKREQFEKAESHYRKVLEIHPQNEIAQFMLQSIGGEASTPDAAPVDHVRSIFDQCAENFEDILVGELEYKTPELLFQLLRPYLTKNMEILDLGCGTGLGAVLYQPFAKRLTGVDVSEKMLEKAAEKKIYSSLKVFDIMQPWVFPVRFDLIYSSDVLVYFGRLDQVIKSAVAALAPGGKIAFSVEKLKDNSKNYALSPSGRYAHSQRYIQTCLNRYGLNLLALDSTAIRKQSGDPVTGFLVVAEK